MSIIFYACCLAYYLIVPITSKENHRPSGWCSGVILQLNNLIKDTIKINFSITMSTWSHYTTVLSLQVFLTVHCVIPDSIDNASRPKPHSKIRKTRQSIQSISNLFWTICALLGDLGSNKEYKE